MAAASGVGGSRTALMVAAWRAQSDVCDDPWAAALAGDEGFAIAAAYAAHNPHMPLWLGLRTHVIDRLVRDDLAAGTRQVVILGAGLDTRAVRLAREGVAYYEVDLPATQAEKRARVARLDGYPADAATWVACDFERDDFVERLVASGFDTSAPAFVVWEGVAYYLPEAAVRATLTAVATRLAPGSAIVFDMLGKRFVTAQDVPASDRAQTEALASLGEPVRFGTNDVVPLVYESGFRNVRTLSFDEACLSVTGSYERARAFRFQSLVVASRGRGLWPLA